MSDYSSLKATINANIKANNNHEITGAITNSVLNAMVNSLGAGYQFIGVATPTNPGSAQTPDYKCFYLATTPGTYTNLGSLVVTDGEVAILKYDSSWTKEVTGIATTDQLNQLGQEMIYDVSVNNDGATFASLSALLSDVNLSTLIPVAVRCGGMSIRFVQSSDNKYVQFRYMGTSTADADFTNVANWQCSEDKQNAFDIRGILYGKKGYTIKSWIGTNSFEDVNSDSRSIVIPVVGGCILHLQPKESAPLFICKSFSIPVIEGQVPDLCNGETGRRSISEESTITLPNDAQYVIIGTNSYGYDITPLEITINGIDYTQGPLVCIENIPKLLHNDNLSNLYLYGLSSIPITNGQISDTNNGCYRLGQGSHKAIPVNGGDIITIETGNYSAQVFWLKSYEIPTKDYQVPNFCAGHSARETLTSGTYTAPSDCNYLVIGYLTSTINISPKKILINDFDIAEGLLESSENNSNIVELKQGSFESASSTYTIHSQLIPVNKALYNTVSIKLSRPNTSGYKYLFGFRTFGVKTGDPSVLAPIRDISALAYKKDTVVLNEEEQSIAFTIIEYDGNNFNSNFIIRSFEDYPSYVSFQYDIPAYSRNKQKEVDLINACRLNIESDGSKDCQILLLGDQHGDGQSVYNAVQMLNNFPTIDAMINLGDCNPSYFVQTFSDEYFNIINRATKPVFQVLGNHDVGYTASVQNAGSNQQVYNKWIAPIIAKGWLSQGEYVQGKNYYYHDFTNSKIRLIVLYLYDDDNEFYEGYWKPITYNSSYDAIGGAGTSYTAGQKINLNEYTEHSFECVQDVTVSMSDLKTVPLYKFTRGVQIIRQEQAQWFLDTLCATPANFTAVIAMHYLPSPNWTIDTNKGKNFCQNLNKTAAQFGNFGESTDFVSAAIEAFEQGNSFSMTVQFKSYTGYDGVAAKYAEDYNISKDFGNKHTNARCHCLLCGHTHYDLVWKSNDYLQYAVNPLAAIVKYDENHVFNDGGVSATDICRSQEDGVAYDSLTAISFNNSRNMKKVSLVKIGVDRTIDGVKRDFAVLDLLT